jgi:hypothetical protein
MGEEQRTKAIMIVEIAGRPAEHVKEVLENHVEQIGKIKGVKVVSKDVNEPKKLEIEQEMYSCFAELVIETESFQILVDLIFDLMPSSVEILEPSSFKLSLQEATGFLNTLAGRLHKYDEVAKVAQLQAQQLAQRLQAIQAEASAKEEKKASPKKKASKKKSSKKPKAKKN